MRIIDSQNIIIENLQKNLDDIREERNKQKMKNRLRVEKSRQRKKKEQCNGDDGGDDLGRLVTAEGGDEKEGEGKKEMRLKKRDGEAKRKFSEDETKESDTSQKRKKKKKTKADTIVSLGNIKEEDMIGVGEMTVQRANQEKNEGSQMMMQWWTQPQGQCTSSQSMPPMGVIPLEGGSGNFINNNNVKNENINGGGGDYFSDRSNFYTEIGNIQFDQLAIDKILEEKPKF